MNGQIGTLAKNTELVAAGKNPIIVDVTRTTEGTYAVKESTAWSFQLAGPFSTRDEAIAARDTLADQYGYAIRGMSASSAAVLNWAAQR